MPATKTISQKNEEAARRLADRLKQEGRAFDANIILAVCRSLVGTRESVKRFHADNIKLRERLKK